MSRPWRFSLQPTWDITLSLVRGLDMFVDTTLEPHASLLQIGLNSKVFKRSSAAVRRSESHGSCANHIANPLHNWQRDSRLRHSIRPLLCGLANWENSYRIQRLDIVFHVLRLRLSFFVVVVCHRDIWQTLTIYLALKPVARNDTGERRTANRRVVINLIKK